MSSAPLPSLNPSRHRGYLAKPQTHYNYLFGINQGKDESSEWSDKDDSHLLGHMRSARNNRSAAEARFRPPLSSGTLPKDLKTDDMKREDVSIKIGGEWAEIQAALPNLIASLPQADDPGVMDHINVLRGRLDAMEMIHRDPRIIPHTRKSLGKTT